MKINFNNYNDLEEFILANEEKYIFDIIKDAVGTGFTVNYEEQKYYVAQDGKSYPDEVWLTKDGDMLQIQDITLDHCQNIIRLLLRNQRMIQMQQMADDMLDESEPTETESTGHTLH